MKIVRLPKLMTVGWSKTLLEKCENAVQHNGPVAFDFANVEWAAPFGLTVISITLERCFSQKQDVFYQPPKNASLRKYLERIGFHYYFLKGGAIKHQSTSVELRRLRAVDPLCIDAIVNLMAETAPTHFSDDDKFDMKAQLIEMMTNAFDHSASEIGCYVCAQWYPQTQNLRVSFADCGIGILTSLRTKKRFSYLRTDIDAIRESVKPGVTTRKARLGGFGLDYLKTYAKGSQGTLAILSGQAKVNFRWNKIENRVEDIRFPGTIIDLCIPMTKSAKPTRRKESDLF